MESIFEKYFTGNLDNLMIEKRKLTSDIRNNRITRRELDELIAQLDKNGYFNEGEFKKKESYNWDEDYFFRLSTVQVTGKYSKELLEHMYEVAEYLRLIEKNKHKKRMIGVSIGVLVVITLAAFIINQVINKQRIECAVSDRITISWNE